MYYQPIFKQSIYFVPRSFRVYYIFLKPSNTCGSNKTTRTSALIFLLLSLLSSALSGQGSFQKIIQGTSGIELGRHILETKNGYLIAGYTTSSGAGAKDAYLVKIDKLGNILWQRTYGGASNDAFNIITKGNNGGYLVLGDTESTGNGSTDVLLVKVDDIGSVEWSKTFGGRLADVSPVHGVMVNLADGYLVSGQQLSTPDNGSTTGTYMIRFDNNGNVIWSRNYESASNYLVANYVEGNIIYAGGSNNYDACFAKFDLKNGDLISLKSYGGSGSGSLYSVRPTADGNFILSDGTWSYSRRYMSLWVMKVNKDGDIAWSKVYRKESESIRGAAMPTADGGIFITPYQPNLLGSNDGLFLKTDANGVIKWSAKYGNDNSENFIKGVPTSDGGCIGIGRANDSSGKEHVYVVKTNKLGSVDDYCAKPNTDIITDVFTPYVSRAKLEDATPFTPKNWTIKNTASKLTIKDYCKKEPPPKVEPEKIKKITQVEPEKVKNITNVDPVKIKKGDVLQIPNLYFDANKSDIKSECESTLIELYNFLSKNPKVVVEVGGHTNSLPSDSYANKLSTNRARSVAEWLIKKGIPDNRVQYKGYGKINPIAPNTTEAGKKKNQRVEMKILNIDD
jgi:outer membrane protein OmpA-like peptidoglycan-associated protein